MYDGLPLRANLERQDQIRQSSQNFIDPIVFADQRITVGPNVGYFSVDGLSHRLPMLRFKFLHELAQSLDEVVSYDELIKALYGWEGVVGPNRDRFKNCFKNDVGLLRAQLGDELGDRKYGAVRTVQNVGYVAVSVL